MISQTLARAPMATVLVGLIAGLILARHYQASSILTLTFAFGSSLTALLLSLKGTCKLLWTLFFIASATLSFWAYGSIVLTPEPSESDLAMPQREARLTMRVHTVLHSNERYKSASVIACVLHTPRVGRLRKSDLIYARLKLPEEFFLSTAPSTILQKGLQLHVTGLLTPIPESAKSKSRNDFYHYLKSIGVHYQFDRTNEPEIKKLPSAFTQFCAVTNQRFQTILKLGTPENSELANIYVTMLLGNNSALNKEQRERYRTTGTMHFFAISGLHIGVIAAVIAQCLILIRIPRSWGPWIGLPLLYLYVEITGASPSAMRAFLMTAFFWASFAIRRQHAPFTALINSAIAVLIVDPMQLWSLGFQLSYTVVASILLLGLPISLLMKQSIKFYQWLPKEDWSRRQQMVSSLLDKIFPLFAISLSAWLASMPLCAAFFNFIAPGAIILNILLVCLVSIAIVSGILSIGCAVLLLLPVSEFINHAAWLVLFIMDWIVQLGTVIPHIAFLDGTFLPELSYLTLIAYFSSLFWLHCQPERLQTRAISLPVIVLLISMVVGCYYLKN